MRADESGTVFRSLGVPEPNEQWCISAWIILSDEWYRQRSILSIVQCIATYEDVR